MVIPTTQCDCERFLPIVKGLHEIEMSTFVLYAFKCAYDLAGYLINKSYPLFIPILKFTQYTMSYENYLTIPIAKISF